MKKVLDFFFAFALIILISPFFLIIALTVKLTSKGAVFFKQRRIGLKKKEFMIYKFRTMYSEAPKDVPTHLLNDPEKHITPIGRFLRKTSLDELPQLINILKGDMSFIGPRPALYNQYDLIGERDRYGVNGIKPGISGWAQVNGRDELEIREKVEYDKYYLEHMSIRFDVKILAMTLVNVVRSKGIAEGAKSSGTNSIKIE